MNDKEAMTKLLARTELDGSSLVKHVIRKDFGIALSNGYDEEELMSVASWGLYKGLRDYDPRKAVKYKGIGDMNFVSFLCNNIQRAIIDYMRGVHRHKIVTKYYDLPNEEQDNIFSRKDTRNSETTLEFDAIEEIRNALSSDLLSDKEKEYIREVYCNNVSRRSLAKKLGSSREALRKIEDSIKEKLRSVLSENHL